MTCHSIFVSAAPTLSCPALDDFYEGARKPRHFENERLLREGIADLPQTVGRGRSIWMLDGARQARKRMMLSTTLRSMASQLPRLRWFEAARMHRARGWPRNKDRTQPQLPRYRVLP
jgi:hypothetical protein